MIYLCVIIGIIIMAVMIFMAVGKKSDKKTRFAAIIALAVMILSIIICLFVLFSAPTANVDRSALIVGETYETEKTGGNTIVLIVLTLFLIILFLIVAFLAMKEARKQLPVDPKQKPISNW